MSEKKSLEERVKNLETAFKDFFEVAKESNENLLDMGLKTIEYLIKLYETVGLLMDIREIEKIKRKHEVSKKKFQDLARYIV